MTFKSFLDQPNFGVIKASNAIANVGAISKWSLTSRFKDGALSPQWQFLFKQF